MLKIDKNNFIKWVLRILGVVLLGAMGSGVWQIIGEPFVNFIAKITIDSIDFLIGSYKDSIYLKASKGFHESSATSLYILVLTLPPLAALSFLSGVISAKKNISRIESKSEKLHKEEKDKLKSELDMLGSTIKNIKRMLILTMLLFMVVCFNMAVKTSYTNRIITYVETSLDRLSPYENISEIIKLRAKFREVTSATEYYTLYEVIEEKLKANGLPSKGVEPL